MMPLFFFVFSSYATGDPLAGAGSSNDVQENYQIVGKVYHDDLRSLEKVLSGGGDRITGKRSAALSEFPEVVSPSHFPQIIYNIAKEENPEMLPRHPAERSAIPLGIH